VITIQPNGETKRSQLSKSPILQSTLDYILENDLLMLAAPMCEHAGYEMYYLNPWKSSSMLEMNTFAMYIAHSQHRIRGVVSIFTMEEMHKPRSPLFNPGVRKLFDDRLEAFISMKPETTKFFRNKHHELHTTAAR
jgi:hypothetical protein